LVLRLVISLSLIIQATAYLSDWGKLAADGFIVQILSLSAGLGLLAGILTPAISLLVVLVGIGYGFSWIPSPTANLFNGKLAVIHLIALGLALFCLGPGAFSLDAWLFGRREIHLPDSRDS